jgi:hypothetical protein
MNTAVAAVNLSVSPPSSVGLSKTTYHCYLRPAHIDCLSEAGSAPILVKIARPTFRKDVVS